LNQPLLVEPLLELFDEISLSESGSSLLSNRFDSKYIFHFRLLPLLLSSIKNEFYVLEVNRQRIHGYETLYFDTPDFKLYYEHHNGKPHRMKVRVRKYLSSGEVFFEIKHKLKGYKTGKLRLPQQKMMFDIGEAEWSLINSTQKNIQGLEPKLFSNFSRISLQNKQPEERVTFDVGLIFSIKNSSVCFKNVVVMEVKHLHPKPSECLLQLIHQHRLTETSFSKYAMGVALLENSVRKNLFKPTILQLKKIENG
jgi:hypothetical protein